jgi:hypothetical protein
LNTRLSSSPDILNDTSSNATQPVFR